MKSQTLTLAEQSANEFKRNPNLGKIVEAMLSFGIGTVNTVMITSQLPRPVARFGLAKLASLGILSRLNTVGKVDYAREGRPEKPYIFTEYAPGLLGDLGYKGVQMLNLDGPLDVSHRLCIALVGCHAFITPEVEKVIHYGDGKNMRFDLVSPQDGNPRGRIVEIEQALSGNNKDRAVVKLRGINEAIAAHPNQLDEEALIVFNLTDEKLPRTLKVWRKALREAGNLACMIRYCTLRTFMQTPYIDAIADLPILTPPDEKPGKAAEEEPLPALIVYTPDDISDLLAEARDIARSIPGRTIHPEQEVQRFANFFAILREIYAGSFGQDGATNRYCLFPSTSLEWLTAFLHLRRNRTLLARMRRSFKEVRKRQSGVTLYQDAISKFIWGTFLRQFGLGRGGPLAIYIKTPEVGGKNTEINFDVQLNTSKAPDLKVPDGSLAALEWVLSAFLLYPEELGLAEPGRD
jgi:hypothetical protein